MKSDPRSSDPIRITASVHQRPLTFTRCGRLVQRVLDRVPTFIAATLDRCCDRKEPVAQTGRTTIRLAIFNAQAAIE
jgi:hypothetical protein